MLQYIIVDNLIIFSQNYFQMSEFITAPQGFEYVK
jgi:hypothetical protein